MAPAIPFIMAATSALGAGMSFMSYQKQKKAANTAEEIGRQNAAHTEAETQEEATRLRDNQRRVLAETRALASTSGVSGGTQDIYSQDMATKQTRELKWLQKSGKSRADIERLQGAYTAQGARADAMGSLGQAVGYAGQAIGYGSESDLFKT